MVDHVAVHIVLLTEPLSLVSSFHNTWDFCTECKSANAVINKLHIICMAMVWSWPPFWYICCFSAFVFLLCDFSRLSSYLIWECDTNVYIYVCVCILSSYLYRRIRYWSIHGKLKIQPAHTKYGWYSRYLLTTVNTCRLANL